MIKKRFLNSLAVISLTLVWTSLAYGQGTTSRITGLVVDRQGAPVSGATVSIRREGTDTPIKGQTSDIGVYTFDLIQAGTYEITVEKQGFKKFVSIGNTAFVNQPSTVNVTLEVGDVSATVSVSGTAEQVQTSTSGNVGTTVEQRTLESLPIVGLRGRNPLDLLNFQPGVVFGGNTGGAVNVHGSRDRAFNFTLDGIDINESTAGGSNFTPLRPNPDSVQEFQIVTSNFTAELGRSSGAQVTFVTRSGTNQFHGNLFEYYMTPDFNAKSYTNTINNLAKDQFVQHIFGGSLGGPIVKNKLFFFTNVQLLRAYDTAVVTRTVYTSAARTGLYRYVAGRANAPAGTSTPAVDGSGNPVVPACTGAPPTNAPCIASYNAATSSPVSIDSTLQGFLNAMPLPNNFTVGDGLNTAGYSWGSPQHEKQYDFVTKIDYTFNPKNAFYVRYARGDQNSFGDSANGGRPVFPDSGNLVDTFRTPRNIAANWRWSPSARFTNEFIYGDSRYGFKFATPVPDPKWPFGFLNATTPKTNFSYNARSFRTTQFVDNMTFDASPHTIKAGTNLRFGKAIDDRSSVAGSAIEPIVTFSSTAATSGFTGYNLPLVFNSTTNPTGIISADLTRLQNTLADLLGRIGNVSAAFVLDRNNPNNFLPAGSRWLNEHHYREFDFYAQDNWRVRPNFVLDLGLRWEIKLTPRTVGRQILVPNQPVKIGAAPSNSLTWVPGQLFKSDYSKFLPSVGFAWDPFKNGKTSIRGNYRISSDRIATFLFGSNIFQGTPGNNTSSLNSAFGQGGGLYRDLAPVIAGLVPTQTPTALRTPPALSSNSLNVVDPDLKFPQVHSFSLSFQRELMKSNVFEFNYIRKHAVHLQGGYNVNQVNLGAVDPRCPGQSFLDAFKLAQDSTQTTVCLIPLLVGTSGAPGTLASFRSTFSTQLSTNNVASVAQTLAQRSGTTSLTANGFSPFFFMPFPQYAGGFNVFDSNDYSNYQAAEFIFKRRMSAGLSFQAAYTLSKSLDNRSWDPSLSTVSTGSVQSASSTPFDIKDRKLNYTYSDFDRRHVFQSTFVWELPFGRDKWVRSNNRVGDYIIGGWQLSGTAIWQSGRPFTVYSGSNTLSNVVQSTANCNGCSRNLGKLVLESGKNFWFDTAARSLFSVPAAGTIGNVGRNYFLAPTYAQLDASLLRKFRLTERWNFDLRVDARNLFNNPAFDNPTAVITSSIFGRINDSVTNNARRIQISGKLNF